MVEKEDLGLSLSLSFTQNNNQSVQLNLMPAALVPSSTSSSPSGFSIQKPWNEAFPSSGVVSWVMLTHLHDF